MLGNPSFRATVVYSNSATGEIRVRIPSIGGVDDTVPISYIGRTQYNGTWPVPGIGSQIVVTTSDTSLYNVYWLQVQPQESLQGSITELNNQLQETNNKLDALMLGIFS
jgi:hypothetical protein